MKRPSLPNYDRLSSVRVSPTISLVKDIPNDDAKDFTKSNVVQKRSPLKLVNMAKVTKFSQSEVPIKQVSMVRGK